MNVNHLMVQLLQDSYAKVIGNTPDIVELLGKIRDVMEDNHTSCQTLQEQFMRWAFTVFNLLLCFRIYNLDEFWELGISF